MQHTMEDTCNFPIGWIVIGFSSDSFDGIFHNEKCFMKDLYLKPRSKDDILQLHYIIPGYFSTKFNPKEKGCHP
jgi:hypothetical protein